MRKYIEIKCDTNDADYITERNLITDEELELIKPIIKKIKQTPRHNFPTSEFESKTLADLYPEFYKLDLEDEEEDYEYQYKEIIGLTKAANLFFELVPYGEHGVHTIVSIKILEVVNETTLL